MFKIYALYHNDTLIYVGKTKRTLKKRLSFHFTPSSDNRLVREYMDEHGRNRSDYKIEQLDSCYLEYPEVAKDIERSYVQWLKPPCNATPDGQGGFQKGENHPMKDSEVAAKAGAKSGATRTGLPHSEERKAKLLRIPPRSTRKSRRNR